jgi:hypothetical protein
MVTPPQPPRRNPWNIFGWVLLALVVAAIVITILVIIGSATLSSH